MAGLGDRVVTAKDGILNLGELMAKNQSLPLAERAMWRRMGRIHRIQDAMWAELMMQEAQDIMEHGW